MLYVHPLMSFLLYSLALSFSSFVSCLVINSVLFFYMCATQTFLSPSHQNLIHISSINHSTMMFYVRLRSVLMVKYGDWFWAGELSKRFDRKGDWMLRKWTWLSGAGNMRCPFSLEWTGLGLVGVVYLNLNWISGTFYEIMFDLLWTKLVFLLIGF